MNWTMLAAIVVCIPVFALFPEKYKRFDIDTQGEDDGTAKNIQREEDINGTAHNIPDAVDTWLSGQI